MCAVVLCTPSEYTSRPFHQKLLLQEVTYPWPHSTSSQLLGAYKSKFGSWLLAVVTVSQHSPLLADTRVFWTHFARGNALTNSSRYPTTLSLYTYRSKIVWRNKTVQQSCILFWISTHYSAGTTPSLIPRPSLTPVFDYLEYAKM